MLCRDLIGRAEEVATIKAAVSAAARGQGAVIVITGEAGVGKSRMLREAAGLARQAGLAVLAGHAVFGGGSLAYRPLAEALQAWLRGTPRPDLPGLEPYLAALGRLVPAWRAVSGSPGGGGIVLCEAVTRVLATVGAGRGCLLTIEDLHWADPETLTVLEYVCDNVAAEPVLCLLTLRDEEPSPAQDLLTRLSARRAVTPLALARLTDDQTADMARDALASDDLPSGLGALLNAADGLPFFVEELLAGAGRSGQLVWRDDRWQVLGELEATVPLTFAESVARRLAALPTQARAVLNVAAALGRQFNWELLPEVTGLPREAVLDILRAAVDTQLLAVAADTVFRFRHALTRAAILSRMLHPERAALAARCLAEVERAHAGLPGEWCGLAAELAEQAGTRDRAAELYLEVGRRALVNGALATAEATLERASALTSRADLLIEIDDALAETVVLAGNVERAFQVGQRLLSRLENASPARRAAVHVRLAQVTATASQWSVAEEQVKAATELAAEASSAALQARINAVAAHVAIGRNAFDEAEQLARRAVYLGESAHQGEVVCEALEVVGRCARRRDLAEAEEAFQRAFDHAARHGLTVWRLRALHELGTIDLLDARSADRLQEARRLAADSGALATAAVLDLQLSAWHSFSDVPESAAIARRCAQLASRLRLEVVHALALTFQAVDHMIAHRQSEAEAALSEAMSVAGDETQVQAAVTLSGDALQAVLREDRTALREALDAAEALLAGTAQTYPFRGLWALLRVIEDRDGAAAVAQLRAAGLEVSRPIQGLLHYAQTVALAREGNPAEADAEFDKGDIALTPVPWLHHYARRVVAEAAIADGWGRPAGWLRDALVFFEQHGADRIATACRSLLRKAGEPVPRRGRGASQVPTDLRTAGVTSREHDVLLLVAEGLTNNQIGERLYLSPRTVERHISSLLRKTGSASRAQLAALAARHGLTA